MIKVKDFRSIVLGLLIGSVLGAIVYFHVPIPWHLKIAIGGGIFSLIELYEWKSKRVKLERKYKERVE